MPPSWTQEREAIDAILRRYPQPRSAIMPLLHLAQERRGHLAREDLEAVGRILGLTLAEVESVASFYALYYRQPVGRYVITVCGNLSCQLAGARELLRHLERRLGIRAGETTPDGAVTLHWTPECLAACDMAPALQVSGYYVHRVDERRADELLRALQEGRHPRELADRARLPDAAEGRGGAGGGGQGVNGSARG